MFGLFGKKKKWLSKIKNEDYIDMDIVKVWYEGEVLCGDYDLNNPNEYPFHNLFPDGKGKIVYKIGEQLAEQYEGQFKAGQYHGYGILIDKNGEVFEGKFIEGFYK